jgi:hypothetical protein
MRTITGREFARMIERRGWQLLESAAATTSTASE